MKIDWKRKLTSRKLWLSVASFVSMLLIFFQFSETEAHQIAAIIMAGATVIAYVIGEGLADGGDVTLNHYSNDTIEKIEDKEE